MCFLHFPPQVTSQADDPLNKILMELPVPGDEMLTNKHVPLTLDLIQQTRDNLGEIFDQFCVTFYQAIIAMCVSDEYT